MRALLASLVAAMAALGGGAAAAGQVRNPHATVELVAETAGAAPGSTLYAAVVLAADKGWHTYWRNPGDAGEATKIAWTLPAGWKAGDIVWPTPSRLPVGPIMNYGYEGRAILASPVEIPAEAPVGEPRTLTARVDYLVCAEVCVPGQANVSLTVPLVTGAPPLDPKWGRIIEATLAAAPKPAGLVASFQRLGSQLTLSAVGDSLAGAAPNDVYFYPYNDSLIDQAKPQAVERGPRGFTLAMASAPVSAGVATARAQGVLVVDDRAYEIDARPGPPQAGSAGLGPLRHSPALGLPLAIASAILGGLILNLMPCVFPILSMKAAALARQDSGAGGEGAAYAIGVLVSFGVLAGVIIAAKAAGQAVGWGFQLQSPVIVAVLALVMLACALDLSGVFEVGASIQGLGAQLHASGQLAGGFLTGVLAVVVAAPCTAPFMGPALGYALTQPPLAALAVFAGLAIGFATPFTVLAATPGLRARLPGPGPWMEGLKKALAFPMYGAAAWLVWVFARQTGDAGLARLLAAGLAVALAAWLYGVAQRARAVSRRGALPGLAAFASLAAAIGVLGFAPFERPAAVIGAPTATTLASQPYSPERLAALRVAGTPVLVNFTAAWCVTCQVNERLAFSSPEVSRAMKAAGAVYLVADWTDRDPVIAKALAEQGRIGVPLYLYYPAGAQAPEVLPQLLTPAIVAQAVSGRAAG